MALGEIVPGCHLYWAEVACRDGTAYPEDLRDTVLLKRVIPAWVAIRKEVCLQVGHDTPILPTSFYRTEKYNRQINGEPGSFHCLGMAWDSTAAPEMPVLPYGILVAKMARLHPELGIRGVGLYLEDGIVHVDVRPTKPIALWRAVYVHDPKTGKANRKYLQWTGEGVE